ncbi:MAG TPA: tRNA (adenosine(37)-N6)-threonylcarbamoyltransferase complex ATPase subunit type 1 TsaE [Anaerolineales bacterium]|nr:tRNA (adenosine(37)-N6)-threonylcarbamoyltransferase complex ATPase subunit type 1 TsaE [Anaerolineales bacterium]
MPILDPNSMEFISRSAEQTRRVGMRLGAFLQPGDVVALQGDLGAGKTTLVQGVAHGWGSLDQASSPTFVLVNVYRRPDGHRLYHLDAYRLANTAEAWDLDLEHMLSDGPLVVEWANRIQGALPAENLWIRLRYIEDAQRDLIFTAHGARYETMLHALREKVFGVK